jgi:hypothetical protein
VELHEAALLEWAQEVAERRAVHDEQPRKILNRARTDAAEPGKDGVLVNAQARGRKSIVIESRDAPRRLAKGGAVTSLGLDLSHCWSPHARFDGPASLVSIRAIAPSVK